MRRQVAAAVGTAATRLNCSCSPVGHVQRLLHILGDVDQHGACMGSAGSFSQHMGCHLGYCFTALQKRSQQEETPSQRKPVLPLQASAAQRGSCSPGRPVRAR